MPPAVAAVAAFVNATILATGAIGFISRVIFSVAISALVDKFLAPGAPRGVGLSGRDVTVRSALEYRKIVYGKALVSGPVAYTNLSGTNGEDLWYVIPLCHGRSEAIDALWLDDERIPVADINWTPGTGASDGTGDGAVSTARWVGTSSTTAVFAFWALGYDTQPVNGPLNTAHSDIDTNFRLRGITYGIVKLRYNENTEKVWENGAPNHIKFEVKGRLVYDSRLDSTNGGSGPQRFTDSTTWTYSTNPILCTVDYLTQFIGAAPATAIRWTDVADSADDCDVNVLIPPASPTTNETRFTCNGSVSLGQTHIKILEAVLSSCVGKLSKPSDQWRIRASVWEATSDVFIEDDLAAAFSIQGSRPESARWNVVRGFFVDPDRNYHAVEFPHVTASEFVTRDGGEEIPKDIELPFTNSGFMAQRIAYRVLEQGDRQISTELPLNPVGARVIPGQRVDFTFGEANWSTKSFGVLKWIPRPDGGFTIGLLEDESGHYTDPLVAEYSTESNGTITVPSVVVAPPSALTATGEINGVLLAWTNPASRLFQSIEVWGSDDNDRTNATKIADTTGIEWFESLIHNFRNRYYWIRARSFDDEVSAWHPVSSTAGVTNNPLPPPIGLLVDPDFDLSDALGSTSDGLDFLWIQNTTDENGIPSTASSVTFQSGGGANSSNAVKLVKGDPPNSPRKSTGFLIGTNRFRSNIFDFKIQLRWRNNGSNTFTDLIVGVVGFAAQTGGSAITNAGDTRDYVVTGTTWQLLTLTVSATPADTAQFWQFQIDWTDTLANQVEEIEIDSIFVFPNP